MFAFLKSRNKKQIIGRLETVDFPEFGIVGIQAKVDTGAYRSTIHATSVREENGVLAFTLLDEEHPQFDNRTFVARDFAKVRVKSTIGKAENRYKIKTPVVILGKTFITDFTLSDRASMRYPVLIGRKVLRHRFVVDVARA